MIKQSTLFLLCLSLFLFLDPQPVYAYIGPGAGFVFITSFLMIIGSFFMVLFTLLTWPIRVLVRAFKNRNAFANAKTERVVILGLDGLEPTITERMLDEGKLPNLKKLQAQGSYSRLQTTWPALSPVAWSAFSTGVNPGKNNIFDFLSRNRNSYLPELSSAKISGARRKLSIGKYELPLGKPSIRFLRRSQSFWKILGDRGIFSHILRVPISFPPEKFNGIQLSAMCTPDLWGTQGTFSFFTTDESIDPIKEGGETAIVQKKDDRVEGFIKGPENTITKKKEHLKLPFVAKILNKDEIELTIGKETYHLKKNIYTDWIELRFKAGFGINVHGIARFYLIETQPHFRLYMTPINIDPEKPALPVSYPYSYSVYLSKLFGKYATLGLAEDTWSLNEGILDDTAFLEQTYMIHEERETQFFDALDKTKKGLCAVVIDATDRIQHMFFRTLDDDHPANKYNNHEKHKNVIEDLYMRMDDLVGRTMQKLGKDDVFIVLSDHGFKPFKRGINLNVWLQQNGYLNLKNGVKETGDFLIGVDWTKTKAYAIGLAGIYLNVKGREKQGVVKAGEEYQTLKRELIKKLSGLKDPQSGETAITEMFDAEQIYNGPYTNNGPDLISGYNVGYRISWDGATGIINGVLFEDNTKPWSGDHCIDPRLVPGVIFCNRRITSKKPALIDIAPTVLNLFGVEPPGYMEGVQIFDEEVNGGVDEVASQEVSEEISQKQIGSSQ
ncbi:MAG: nucleotide pyrophosphatase [Caldithrix sp.]|nr:MAG: nucleotide pyrophosphatase [Caldithrix sp.]